MMEIRCSNCQHVGPAAEVVPTADGVVLVCENCDHRNPLQVSKKESPPEAPAPAEGKSELTPEQKAQVAALFGGATPDESADNESPLLQQGALERLIPEEGPGPRCRKCAHLLTPEEAYCPRCGLSVAEGERFGPGEAPWEVAPPGKEAEFEQATLLWKALLGNRTDENLAKFATFVKDEGLLEYGVRQLRFFLAEHPGDERATSYLNELASSFQAKMIVARAHAAVRSDSFGETAARVKAVLLWLVFMIWGGIFLYFVSQISGGCG